MPTRDQIAALIDSSIRNKTTPYSIDNVEVAEVITNVLDFANGLTDPFIEIAMSDRYIYVLPAGFAIYKIYVRTIGDNSTFAVGDSLDGEELLSAKDITTGVTLPISISVAADTDRTIYFTIPRLIVDTPDSFLKIFLHKI